MQSIIAENGSIFSLFKNAIVASRRDQVVHLRARRHVMRLLKKHYPGRSFTARLQRWLVIDFIVMRVMREYQRKPSPYTLYRV